MNNRGNISDGIEFGELARAAEGLMQWRPMLLGFASLLLCAALMGIGGAAMASVGGLFGVFLAFFLGLIALLVMFGGFSAVGVMLMDKARNLPARSLGDAVMLGLLCLPRFLLLALMLVALAVGISLIAGLLYLVCKVPYLGAVLAFFVHPALIVVTALVILAVIFVAVPLFAPAVWSGLSFRQAMSSLVAVARKRLVQVVLMLIVLYLIVSVVMGLLFLGLLPATAMMSTLAVSIVPSYSTYSVSSYDIVSMVMVGMNAGGGALAGAMAGLMVLVMLIGALLTQVWLMGFNLIYIQAVKGIDFSEASADLGKVIDGIKSHAAAAKDSAVAAAARAQQVAAERAAAVKAAHNSAAQSTQQQAQPSEVGEQVPFVAPETLHCTACQSVVQPSDAFCGVCGHKLSS